MMKADISIVQSKKGTEIMVREIRSTSMEYWLQSFLQYPYCSCSDGYTEKIWLMYHC